MRSRIPCGLLTGVLWSLVVFPCCNVRGNLAISLFQQDELYFGADSPAPIDLPRAPNPGARVFKVSDTCCVAITGFEGPVIRKPKRGEPVAVSFPADLADLCEQSRRQYLPVMSIIQNVATHFGERYRDCLVNVMEPAGMATTESDALATRLQFAGYDVERQEFFGISYRFAGPSRAVRESVFTRSATNRLGSLSFQGDTAFAADLVADNEKVAQLASPRLRQSLIDLYKGTPMKLEEATECFLELFRLQQEHAGPMGYSGSPVREPFVIYRITRDGVVRVR
jgi:hypothetical protein